MLFFRLSKAFLSLQYHPVYLSQGNELQGRGKLDKNKKMSGLETYALKKLAVRISAAAIEQPRSLTTETLSVCGPKLWYSLHHNSIWASHQL